MVLYLAELHKQKSGFISVVKAELILLACRRTDLSWSSLPKEEVIAAPVDAVNHLNDGALVLADLNSQRQVQSIQEAGRQLANILQNLSRHLEKAKSQEEEINQWKQSLTYQSQELNNRQLEIAAQLEQMQQIEAEFEQLKIQRQQFHAFSEETSRLRQEVERQHQELKGAWEHLYGEQRRLAEQQKKILDEEQLAQLQDLILRLENSLAATQQIPEQLNSSLELVATAQNCLTSHWQKFEQQRSTAQQQQQAVDSQAQELQYHLEEWQQAQTSLEQAKLDWQAQKSIFTCKQEQANDLRLQLRHYEEVYQQLYQAKTYTAQQEIDPKVDLTALEAMPLNELQQLVQTNTQIMEKASHFVIEQEEELNFLHETIQQLHTKVAQATESERSVLELELAEEEDRYRMLSETIVGQRQNLRQREATLSLHQSVLLRRQKNQDEANTNFNQILAQIEKQKHFNSQKLQDLETQIAELENFLQQLQLQVEQQSQAQAIKWQQLQSQQQNLLALRTATAQLWGEVNLYQDLLRPIQDAIDALRPKLETLSKASNTNNQLQTLTQIRQTLHLT